MLSAIAFKILLQYIFLVPGFDEDGREESFNAVGDGLPPKYMRNFHWTRCNTIHQLIKVRASL